MKKILVLRSFSVVGIFLFSLIISARFFAIESNWENIVDQWHKIMYSKLTIDQQENVRNWILYRIAKTEVVINEPLYYLLASYSFFKADEKQNEIQLTFDYNANESCKFITSRARSIFNDIKKEKLKDCQDHKVVVEEYKSAVKIALANALDCYARFLLVTNKKISKL